MGFPCSPRVCGCFLWVLWFPYNQKHVFQFKSGSGHQALQRWLPTAPQKTMVQVQRTKFSVHDCVLMERHLIRPFLHQLCPKFALNLLLNLTETHFISTSALLLCVLEFARFPAHITVKTHYQGVCVNLCVCVFASLIRVCVSCPCRCARVFFNHR